MAFLDLQETLDLIDAGRAAEVIPVLTTWTQQMPTHAAVHVVLARAYEAAGQWSEAQAAWRGAHFLMPNSPAVTEGLARVREAVTRAVPAEEDRLVMDLDLEAELEATLEALFNPFTLPQHAEPPPEPPQDTDPALPQVEAALAAAAQADDEGGAIIDAVDADADDARFKEDTRAALETAEAVPEEPSVAAPTSIYDEIEQLIEEKQSKKRDAPPKAEDTATENITENVGAATPLEDEKKAIEALEAMVREADNDQGVGAVDDWDDFEATVEEGPLPMGEDFEDLERLISELESARIVPQPELEDVAPPDLEDDIEGMVSETLARIYASQRQYQEAARVYEQLALQHPDEADRFTQLAAEMKALAGGS